MKRKSTLKKLLALTFALLLLTLSACQTAPDPAPSSQSSPDPAERPTVTVCMDLDVGAEDTYSSSSLLNDVIEDYAPEFKESYKLEIDSLPGSGPNREPALDHIRVELMSGGGADLYLCDTPGTNSFNKDRRQTGLFQYPKALMQRRMFLPLDDYIQNAQYMEWDKLYPEIMEAGKNEDGQQILPLGWCMHFTHISTESYTPTVDLPMTFDEMLQSDDPGVIYAANMTFFPDSLGAVADYDNDKPAFTEEELHNHLDGLIKNQDRRTVELEESLGRPGIAWFSRMNSSHFTQYDPDSTIIPTYNRDGGATAFVTSFGAVNINAKHPEGAFQILDLLLSKDVQKDSELLSYDYGAPVHMELLKSNKRERVLAPFDLPDGAHKERWGLNEHNYGQLQELVKQITVVDFPTPVHHELQELWLPYQQAETQEEREKLVHDAYRTITMMLAES